MADLSSGLSTGGPGFCPRSVHVGFVVNRGPVGQVIFPVLPFSPVGTFPPTLHVALNRRTNGRSLGTFLKATFFRKFGGGGHCVERDVAF